MRTGQTGYGRCGPRLRQSRRRRLSWPRANRPGGAGSSCTADSQALSERIRQIRRASCLHDPGLALTEDRRVRSYWAKAGRASAKPAKPSPATCVPRVDSGADEEHDDAGRSVHPGRGRRPLSEPEALTRHLRQASAIPARSQPAPLVRAAEEKLPGLAARLCGQGSPPVASHGGVCARKPLKAHACLLVVCRVWCHAILAGLTR